VGIHPQKVLDRSPWLAHFGCIQQLLSDFNLREVAGATPVDKEFLATSRR